MLKCAKSKSRVVLYYVLLFLMSSFVSAQVNKVKIACVGNSITKGSHLDNPLEDCYPSQLRRILSETYHDMCTVNNYGLSGRNMLKKGPNPIWKEPKFKKALEWAPDICIILLGTNDSPPYLWEKFGDEFLKDYLSMIEVFRKSNPNVKFIIGAPTPIWKRHRYGGNTWDKKHNDSILLNGIIPKIEKVAKKTDAILIDFHMPFISHVELFPDLLHPNPTGANQIANMIKDVIDEENMVYKSKSSATKSSKK